MKDVPKIKIELCVMIEGVGQCIVPLEDLEYVRTDPTGYAADLAGISREDFLRFLRADKADQCTAITANGDRCKIYVRCASDAKTFLEDERLCGVHKRCGAQFGNAQ